MNPISQPLSRLRIALLALAILLAIFFRLYLLDTIPPGLHFDEAYDGLEAGRILEGRGFPIFFEGNFGEEPLSIYLVAGAFAILGRSIFNIRLVSALAGILTIPALYLMVRELFWPQASRGVKAFLPSLSALSLALLYWHIHFSRLGIEPILTPLFATLASYHLWRGLQRGSLPSFALSGLFLGGSLYTYRAARLLPLLFLLTAACLAIAKRGEFKSHLLGFVSLFLVAFLVFAPLGCYFLSHTHIFTQREFDLGIFGRGVGSERPWATLLSNLGRSLALFNLRGDTNPRSNLPGRPALDPFLSLAFLVGCGVSLRRARRPPYAFLLLWLVVMLLPTILSEYAPHFRRAVGVTPAVATLTALGLAESADYIEAWLRASGRSHLGRWVATSLVAGGLITSGLLTYRDYFLRWGPSNDLYYAFDVGLVEMAHYIEGLSPQEKVYISPVRADHPTLLFLLGEGKAKSFDGRQGLVLPGEGSEATYIIITHEDQRSLPALKKHLPGGEVHSRGYDRLGEEYFLAYRGGEEVWVEPERPLSADLGGKARLLGFDLHPHAPRRGETLELTLYWQALEGMEADYTVFTHLIGPYNPATGGPLWGGDDSQPLRGSYPTTRWEEGEIVIDRYRILLPPQAPLGGYEIEAGMYLLSTMERLPVLGPGGEGNRILLGRIWVEE